MKTDRERAEESIKGIVIPAEWDEQGNVVSIAISTPQEEEFFIQDSEKARELRRHMREEVEVWAEVAEDASGKKRMMVKDYRKVEGARRSIGG